jgi:hypothetical protein
MDGERLSGMGELRGNVLEGLVIEMEWMDDGLKGWELKVLGRIWGIVLGKVIACGSWVL